MAKAPLKFIIPNIKNSSFKNCINQTSSLNLKSCNQINNNTNSNKHSDRIHINASNNQENITDRFIQQKQRNNQKHDIFIQKKYETTGGDNHGYIMCDCKISGNKNIASKSYDRNVSRSNNNTNKCNTILQEVERKQNQKKQNQHYQQPHQQQQLYHRQQSHQQQHQYLHQQQQQFPHQQKCDQQQNRQYDEKIQRQTDRKKLTADDQKVLRQTSSSLSSNEHAESSILVNEYALISVFARCVCARMMQAAILELKQKYQIIRKLFEGSDSGENRGRVDILGKYNYSKRNTIIKINEQRMRNDNNCLNDSVKTNCSYNINNNNNSCSNSHRNINNSVIASNFDHRNAFYLTLLIAFYCCILIRVSSATSPNNNNNNNNNSNNNNIYPAQTETSIIESLLQANDTINIKTTADTLNSTTSTPSTPITTTISEYESFFNVIDKINNRANNNQNMKQDNNENINNSNSNNNNKNNSNNNNNNHNSNFHLLTINLSTSKSLHQLVKRDAAKVPDEEDDYNYHDDDYDEYEALLKNKSAKGKYIGAPCNNNKCDSTLLHVSCDKETQQCGCEKNYPVLLGLAKGCAKPKKLGEQCFYDETCVYNDENSLCVQVKHNALCQCASGFHSVSYSKPTRRVFCTQDLKELKSDLPTLLGVSTGIAVLAGLICMVLHLFSKTKYPRHRNFGDANLPPPIMYSSETGNPLTVQSGRPSSRSSLRSSGSIGSYGNRRSSMTMQSSAGHASGSAGSKGILVSTSRTGSRRPSLASVHSTSSSIRSYSMMRFEKEAQQKEIRQEMKLRLARLQQQQQLNQNKPQIIIGDTMVHHHGPLTRLSMSTPSPLTPNSLDELLPAVDETQELFPIKSEPTTILPMNTINSKVSMISSASAHINVINNTATFTSTTTTTNNGAYNGPCSSSNEAL